MLVDEVAARFQRLDILVRNAASFSNDRIEEMDDAVLDRLLSANLKVSFTLTRAAIPHLRKVPRGRIPITSSVTGPRVTTPGLAHYAATKGGVNAFIRTAALELAADGITVNGVEAKRSGESVEVAHAMLILAREERTI